MSEDRPKLRVVDEDEAPQGLASRLSQLGLAAYTLLILGIAVMGFFCAVFSLQGAISQLVAPKELSSGFTIDAWRVTELRKEGVLAAEQTPALYHDHSKVGDGSAGCLVVDAQVVRWDAWIETGRVDIPSASLSSSGGDSPTVTITQGGRSVDCPFDEDEGGDRFLTMLRVDAEGG